MPGPLAASLALLAQAAKPAPDSTATMVVQMLPWVGVIALFYLLMIRPQQTAERKRKEMVDALKKNDRVVTQAGIYGTVVSVDAEADRVVLRIDDDRQVKLAVTKSSVARVLEAAEKEKSAAAK